MNAIGDLDGILGNVDIRGGSVTATGTKDSGIICVVPNAQGTECAVYIANSNRNGNGAPENYTGTYENIEASDVIFAK